jgi:hypothetical protein
MKPLTDDQRKLLTLYLGECWHTVTFLFDDGTAKCSCGSRFRNPDECTFHVEQENFCTFTTYEDLGKLKDKLVENGEWEKFENWAYIVYEKTERIKFSDCTHNPAEFTQWLFRPESCGLVAEYLGQKGGR